MNRRQTFVPQGMWPNPEVERWSRHAYQQLNKISEKWKYGEPQTKDRRAIYQSIPIQRSDKETANLNTRSTGLKERTI